MLRWKGWPLAIWVMPLAPRDEDGIGVMTCGSRVVEVGGRDTALLCWLAEDDLRHFH